MATLLGAGADVTIENIDGYAALRCAAWPTATTAAPMPQEDGGATMAHTYVV
jgi:hypothetical protein